MEIKLKISDECESTSYPAWFIVDPQPGCQKDVRSFVSCFTGPFFSRDEAESELLNRLYDYGKKAYVYCKSGCNTRSYRDAIDKAKNKKM